MRSGKQVSSISARIHKILNIHVAWMPTHGLNCENFDRVKLSRLISNQQIFEPNFEMVGVDVFRDGLLDLWIHWSNKYRVSKLLQTSCSDYWSVRHLGWMNEHAGSVAELVQFVSQAECAVNSLVRWVTRNGWSANSSYAIFTVQFNTQSRNTF